MSQAVLNQHFATKKKLASRKSRYLPAFLEFFPNIAQKTLAAILFALTNCACMIVNIKATEGSRSLCEEFNHGVWRSRGKQQSRKTPALLKRRPGRGRRSYWFRPGKTIGY